MTWERFGYICRKTSIDCGEHESVSSCLARVNKEEGCKFYGKKLNKKSWPKKILDETGSIENKIDALNALNVYKELELTEQFEEPMRFKRVVAYLSYVTFIFFIVVGFYQFQVAPSFLNTFDEFEVAIPKYLSWYQDYWFLFVLVISTLLISSLLVGNYLRKLFKFELGIENSFVIRYMAFRSIRHSYQKIIDIIQFPILAKNEENSPIEPNIITHLRAVEKSNMHVSIEMREIIRVEMRHLLGACERQMKVISASIALIVVLAIFFFLASAYSPIFILGETI